MSQQHINLPDTANSNVPVSTVVLFPEEELIQFGAGFAWSNKSGMIHSSRTVLDKDLREWFSNEE